MKTTLLQQLAQRVDENPRQVAMIVAGQSTDYGTLGHWLAAIGDFFATRIERGDRVAILLDNSPLYAAAVYGVWAAGGVVVGLNTALKGRDLANQISHSGSRWLIADGANRELPSLLQSCHCEVLLAGDAPVGVIAVAHLQSLLTTATLSGRLQDAPALAQPSALTDAAQIIYTSGTTGHPKGVVLTHGNLAANIGSICEYLPITADDRMFCVLPFFYSYGNSVLHSHLVAGATLILENSMMYPHKVLESMVALSATAFAGVPSTYNLLLARTKLEDFDLSAIRYCTQAGGPMHKEKIRQWLARMPKAQFFVMYGQTEATARLTYLPPDQWQAKAGSVGIAIPGVTLSVHDEQDNALPAGTTGEVCAQGGNVMAGYWQDEEETRQTLRNGWLHTGDLGYCDEDGYFYLVGRNKEMIKTGAHRVSPREIEELIATVPGVEEVAVVGTPDDVMGQLIKACVIAHGTVSDEQKADIKRQIQRLCKEQLAMYKIPKSVEFYESFPRTSSGKVQKHLL